MLVAQDIQISCERQPGDQSCTERIWEKHSGKPDGCPGYTLNCCVAREDKKNSAQSVQAAVACMSDKATALRRLGHFEHLKERASRIVDSIGSTGEGLGHLADAHAIGRTSEPAQFLGVPPVIPEAEPPNPNPSA